jgi:hypothetical protein
MLTHVTWHAHTRRHHDTALESQRRSLRPRESMSSRVSRCFGVLGSRDLRHILPAWTRTDRGRTEGQQTPWPIKSLPEIFDLMQPDMLTALTQLWIKIWSMCAGSCERAGCHTWRYQQPSLRKETHDKPRRLSCPERQSNAQAMRWQDCGLKRKTMNRLVRNKMKIEITATVMK